MAKKALYFAEAERLYVLEQCTLAEIAARLKLGEKTVRLWKEEGDWGTKRKQYLESKQSFHEELYEFAKKLMTSIMDDMQRGEKVDTGRLYTFARLLPMIVKMKDYEEVLAKREPREQRGLTDDVLQIIQREVLGLEA